MGFYEPFSDEIRGCKEHSWIWWHEKGHQVEFSSNAVFQIHSYLNYLPILAILLFIGEQKMWATLSILIYCMWICMLEMGAWIYCLKHKEDWKI